MKKFVYILIIVATICSCQKEDQNGDLGGFWKLMEIAHSDGQIENTKEQSLFWRVQLDLIQIGTAFGRFQHTGDSLFVQMIHAKGSSLSEYGIFNAEDERFEVLHLNRSGMILQSKEVKLQFRKF
ncbi:MAG: lipocalin-like domain-containing protein [Bacteroidaceae bacterium]|nr:lipocalin-like domain-containing protein [Bacteroidaceae bacterium]